MSETERAVMTLLELTDLQPKLRPVNVAGTLCIEVPNPLAKLTREERISLAERVQHNLVEARV